MVEALAARGETVNFAHVPAAPFDFFRLCDAIVAPLVLPVRGPRDVPFGALLARFPTGAVALRDGAFGALLARLATSAQCAPRPLPEQEV